MLGAAALAQAPDCVDLQARLEATSAGSAQWADAARRQQAEIDRTRAYSESIGCEGLSGFLGAGSPQCDAIASRIARMDDNLRRIEQQAETGRDQDARRGALAAQFAAACGPGAHMVNGDPLDEERAGPPVSAIPVDPDAPQGEAAPANPEDGPPRESKVLCVRACDGGFFPLAERATADKLDGLSRLCKAQCPNAETSLYTTAPSGGLDTAVTPDGAPYSALPAAYRFEKSFDPTCSCKAPGQTWAQALAEAERLLEADRHDVVVTPKLSDVMARPSSGTPAPRLEKAARSTPRPAPKLRTGPAPREALRPGFGAPDDGGF